MVRAPDLKSGGRGFKYSTPWSCLSIANWSASRWLGILSLLCLPEIFLSFSLSGMFGN